jgi:hypothetical protein
VYKRSQKGYIGLQTGQWSIQKEKRVGDESRGEKPINALPGKHGGRAKHSF